MSFHRNHWLLFSTIFFGFIGIAIVIAIAPAYWVQVNTRAQAGNDTLSDLEQRGLEVYVSEGCVACHTQQVRPIPMDKVWGRPSAPRDYAGLGGPMGVWRPYTPAVLGSARNGPDLANIGNRQPSKTWQYLHLYNPRSVVKSSFMPAYPWLFEPAPNPPDDATVVTIPEPYAPPAGQVTPTARGKALVAYLLSLQQKRQAGATQTGGNTGGGPQQAEAAGSGGGSSANGATLYTNNCASCHQGNGQGLAGTFPPLVDDPVVTAEDPTKHIETILNGAQGRKINGQTYPSPMPAFGSQLSDAEIAAIVNHERTSWGNDAPTVTPDDVAALRSSGGQ